MNAPGTPRSLIPTHIGKYEILAVLGRGGMGIVYRARDPRMGREIALKTLTEDFTHDPGMLQRFHREAEKTGRLRHQNIITIYELGEHEGQPYIAMEFIDGEPLDAVLRGGKPLPLISKLRIVEQVCSALAHAHQNDVIHRDVKPANVMIQLDGTVKLLDFGIAVQENVASDMMLTKTGNIIGTVPYMAPERLRGAPLDGRCDIFAVGVMLYQLLTGYLPFSGEEIVLVNKIIHDQPPPLNSYIQDYPPVLDEIISRALAKDPEDRYTADEMAGEIFAVTEIVKEQHTAEVMKQALELSENQDLGAARDMLVHVLRINSQHTGARRLLADVIQRLSVRQRLEAAEKKRQQADAAVAAKDYDGALALLEDASKLAPGNPALVAQIEQIKQKRLIASQVLALLSEADTAKRKGDFSSAQQSVGRALELDRDNSRIRLAYNLLLEQAKEADQRTRARKLLTLAKEKIRQGDYQAALNLAQEAKALYSSDLDLHHILVAAQNGLHEQERRHLLEQLENQVASANTEEQFSDTAASIDQALANLPGDPSLLRHKLQLEEQLHLYRSRRTVEATLEECQLLMETAPLAAREVLLRALANVPDDHRLLSLSDAIEDRIRSQETAAKRTAFILQAREALQKRDFAEAEKVLLQCQKECFSREVADLLQFARDSRMQEQRRKTIAACYTAATADIRAQNYQSAITSLESVLAEGHDDALHNLLNKARAAKHELDTQREQTLQRVHDLAHRGLHEQALAVIKAAPASISRLPELVELGVRMEQLFGQQCQLLERLGHAYRTLNTPEPARDWIPLPVAKDPETVSPLVARLTATVMAKRQSTANQVLESCIAELQIALSKHEPAPGRIIAEKGTAFAPFAQKTLSDQLDVLTRKLARMNTGSRILRPHTN